MDTTQLRLRVRVEEAGRPLAAAFVAALGRGDVNEARAHTTVPFYWFGRIVTDEDWQSPSFAAFLAQASLAVEAVQALPDLSVVLDRSTLAALCSAPVAAADLLFLVDVCRGGTTVSLGLAIGARGGAEPRVRAVFDPAALKERLQARA